jgi:hypothetical protein
MIYLAQLLESIKGFGTVIGISSGQLDEAQTGLLSLTRQSLEA